MGSTGKKTVLVVDDEADVRTFVRTVLVRDGFEVLEAEDGLAALEVVERLSGRIELLVTDVKMPRMDGITLGEKVSTGYPGIEVLYISAYIAETATRGEGRHFLPKPFRPDALVSYVRRLSSGTWGDARETSRAIGRNDEGLGRSTSRPV